MVSIETVDVNPYSNLHQESLAVLEAEVSGDKA